MLLSGIVIVVPAGFLGSPRNFTLNKFGYTVMKGLRLVCWGKQANGSGLEGSEHGGHFTLSTQL